MGRKSTSNRVIAIDSLQIITGRQTNRIGSAVKDRVSYSNRGGIEPGRGRRLLCRTQATEFSVNAPCIGLGTTLSTCHDQCHICI